MILTPSRKFAHAHIVPSRDRYSRFFKGLCMRVPSDREPRLGLATQPFWFYTSFRHRQWGIFIASIFYTLGWAIGVYRNF